ncbi:phosphoribosylformylglycinamidine cyclo-ligase, partial [Vibrio parahaemolyticus]|nr:phosphoribosylformylglycinamidine cyclo-ligase [Vibrio parahaemolyticus]
EPSKIENIVKGISEGCRQAGCALIGGETAEMPGMYSTEEYDLAGFTVGIVDKKKIVTGEKIEAGHVLIGLASSGIHSNGYSLVRKVLLEDGELSLDRIYGRLELPLGEELLKPTKIYVKPILELLKNHEVYGMAHITGGGFIENIPRMLPEGIGAEIELGSWKIQPIFSLLQEVGKLEEKEMFNIFNMGIGMVVAVKEEDAKDIVRLLEEQGETARIIGRTVQGAGVTFNGGKAL